MSVCSTSPYSARRFLGTGLIAGAVALTPLHAQDATPAEPAADAAAPADQGIVEQYKNAMTAFNDGKFKEAIPLLSSLLESVSQDSPQYESIYFTLGSSYFNSKDYPTAISTFTKFIEKYPKSERINEATFALGQAQLLNQDYKAGAATLKKLEGVADYREQVLIGRAYAAQTAGSIDEAISILKQLISPEINSNIAAKGAIQLVNLYITQGKYAEATKLLADLQSHSQFVENIVELNNLTLKLGDSLLGQAEYEDALKNFRQVKLKDDIIAAQEQRIAGMQASIQALRDDNLKNPARAPQNLTKITQITGDIEAANKQLQEFQKAAPIVSSLYLRIAQCFFSTQQYWESILVYQELLDDPNAKSEKEIAAYALTVAYTQAAQFKLAIDACNRYLKDFPKGPHAIDVEYMRGTLAMQLQDFDQGEGWLTKLLEMGPKKEVAEQVRMILGNSKFGQGKYAEAIKEYEQFIKDFPQSSSVEEMEYRIGLAHLFASEFKEAIASFEAYLAKYPEGQFRADAKYRQAVIEYAAEDYPKVIELCQAWQKEFPDNAQQPEVLALEGDAYGSLNKTDEAVAAYQLSAEKAFNNTEALNYALFEATKLLQAEGRWDEISAMFEKFVKDNPGHPTELSALFWIGKAKAREGKADEAKKFLADTAKSYINDPGKEPVEQMLAQLAQLCAKKKLPPATTTPGATPPPAPPFDPVAELNSLLSFAKDSPTAQARLLFAQSELARLRRQPDEQKRLIGEIATKFKPDDLSPALLAMSGENLVEAGKFDQAKAVFAYLMDYYPKTPYLDFSYAGLGNIAFAEGDYPKALQLFTDGTEKIAPESKVKDLLLGQAKSLLMLNRLAEAKKLFEQIAATREWRGEATAESIYSLGEIQWKQQKWAEANAFYQRLFVAYRKFPEWMAKAYLRSAECFLKLQKTPEAIKTYQEMLRNEKLASLPEAKTAREALQKLNP